MSEGEENEEGANRKQSKWTLMKGVQGEDGRAERRKEALREGCVSSERHVGFVEYFDMAYVLPYIF